MYDASDTRELLADAFSAVFVQIGSLVSAQHQSFAGALDEMYVSPESVTRVLSSDTSSRSISHPQEVANTLTSIYGII